MILKTDKNPLVITNYPEIESALSKTAPEWVRHLRKDGLNRFQQLGVPTVKDEEWKYTNLSPLTDRSFRLPSEYFLKEADQLKDYLDTKEINVVFINGKLSTEFSNIAKLPPGLKIINLNVAAKDEDLHSLIHQYNQQNHDAFTALNDALLNEGVFLKVEEKAVIKDLIHIVHVTSGTDNDIILAERTMIAVGKSAQAEVMESHLCFDDSVRYFVNALTDIFLSENSILRYSKAQAESLKSFHIGATRVWQKRDSTFDSFSMVKGALLTRNNLNVILEESGASTILNGLYTVKKDQLVDNHTSVDHRPPNCTSNQLYKGILNDHSRAVFNGKIFVRRLAQQTNSYQLNKNLLLGTDCRVDTKPQLEIFADDVKCTHGATIGQLNEDEIFYLRSRAVPKELAIKILSRGFVDDILNRLSNDSVHQKLNKLIADSFETFV